MSILADQIYQDCQQLPDNLVREVADFVAFLKLRHSSTPLPTQVMTGAEAFKKLSEAGLVGCMEAEENLSEDYKKHLWT